MVQIEHKINLNHRSRIDIIAIILKTAENGAKKTHIMYKCNLSFKQLHTYLNFLTERQLLTSKPTHNGTKNDSTTYQTTTKGKNFIQAYASIRAILSS